MVRMKKIHGFSLMEILVAIAVIVILLALVVPAARDGAMGSAITRGGQMVTDQFALARQEATGKNRDVQVRFLQMEGESGYRGIQLWGQSPTDLTIYRPIGRMQSLPDGTAIASAASLSPMITSPSLSSVTPSNGELPYVGFRIRPGGGTDLKFDGSNSYLTIVRTREVDASGLPKNYAMVQIDPVNGRHRIYRP